MPGGGMAPVLSLHVVPLLWGDTASLTTSQGPATEVGFSRAFSQFPSSQQSPRVHRVMEFPCPLLWATWLHFGSFFRGTLPTSPAPHTHLAQLPTGCCKDGSFQSQGKVGILELLTFLRAALSPGNDGFSFNI